MKIAIVGSREFKYKEFVFLKLNNSGVTHTFSENDGWILNTLISGGARGIDSWAEEFWTKENNNSKIIIKPDWNKYGKRAGFLRNELIIKESDRVIAFWDGQSKGTKHSIDLAIKAGKPIDIYIRK